MPATVHVNFVTYPFEAEVHLDGSRALDDAGRPATTPCTVPNLRPRPYRVLFRRPGLPDHDAGTVDFATRRDVEHRWPGQE